MIQNIEQFKEAEKKMEIHKIGCMMNLDIFIEKMEELQANDIVNVAASARALYLLAKKDVEAIRQIKIEQREYAKQAV